MLRFSYKPTFDDYWRFNRYFILRSFRPLMPVVYLMLGFYLLAPLWQAPEYRMTVAETYFGWLPLLILPGLLALGLLVGYLASRRRWEHAPEVRLEREYEIDERGIRVRGDGMDGFLEWKYLTLAESRDGLFFIKTGQNQFYYFPSKIVGDIGALTELLRANVKNTKI
jgi:hypothetical protein